MARYPIAEWRPLAADPTHQPLMDRHDGIVLHTMVGTLAGTNALFHQDGYTGTESHFGVGADGTVYQWTDTARTADAQLDGNPRLLSIETADMGGPFPPWTGSNVPAWTKAQLDAIARIVAWAAKKHDFPVRAMENSKSTQRGVGWHRLGIDSSPPFQPGYRVRGGEHWSTSVGKVCPGDRRIAQVKSEIIPRAQAILRGAVRLELSQDITPADDSRDETVGDALRILPRMPDRFDAMGARLDRIERKLDHLIDLVKAL